jgi:hypothetical protein
MFVHYENRDASNDSDRSLSLETRHTLYLEAADGLQHSRWAADWAVRTGINPDGTYDQINKA